MVSEVVEGMSEDGRGWVGHAIGCPDGGLLVQVLWCGMVWRGVVKRSVVWRGVVWRGVTWCGMVWCGVM